VLCVKSSQHNGALQVSNGFKYFFFSFVGVLLLSPMLLSFVFCQVKSILLLFVMHIVALKFMAMVMVTLLMSSRTLCCNYVVEFKPITLGKA
jgi:hypothetical protein